MVGISLKDLENCIEESGFYPQSNSISLKGFENDSSDQICP